MHPLNENKNENEIKPSKILCLIRNVQCSGHRLITSPCLLANAPCYTLLVLYIPVLFEY